VNGTGTPRFGTWSIDPAFLIGAPSANYQYVALTTNRCMPKQVPAEARDYSSHRLAPSDRVVEGIFL
ncbi:hypothetical protein AKJ61_04050, partial [candidate division MSBL1 archaeon SCGC-AAA259B11]